MTTRPEPAVGGRPGTGEDHRPLSERWSERADDVPDPVDDGIAVGVPAAPEEQVAPAGESTGDGPTGDGPTGDGNGDGSDIVRAERDEYLAALQRLQADFENYRKRVQRQQEDQAARAASSLVASVLPVLDTLDLALAHLVGAEGEVGAADRNPGEEAGALEQARAQLLDVLGKEGLERVDAAGVDFDPAVHDAVARVAPDLDPPGAPDMSGPLDPSAPPRPSDAPRPSAPLDPSAPPRPFDAPAADVTASASSVTASSVTVDEVLRAGYRWRGQVLRPAMVRVRG